METLLIHLKEMFVKPEDIIVIMHPCRHTPMQEKRKQRGTNERKHKTIKMLIVLCATNMWRGESGGLPWEPPPMSTPIASAVWQLEECCSAAHWKEAKKARDLGPFKRIYFVACVTACCKAWNLMRTAPLRADVQNTTWKFDWQLIRTTGSDMREA